MGTFSVLVTVGNLDTVARESVRAMVDTGATYSVLPTDLLGRLGIAPDETRRLRLANGQVEEYQTGSAYFEVDGRRGIARVVFGPDSIYLLGATTLEDLSFAVDPVNKRLIPADGLLMRGGTDAVC